MNPKQLDPIRAGVALAWCVTLGLTVGYLFHRGADAGAVASAVVTVGGALLTLYNPFKKQPDAPVVIADTVTIPVTHEEPKE